jgi:hypothetical protein
MELLVQAWDELDDLVAALWHVWLRYRGGPGMRAAAPGRYRGISLHEAPYAKQL